MTVWYWVQKKKRKLNNKASCDVSCMDSRSNKLCSCHWLFCSLGIISAWTDVFDLSFLYFPPRTLLMEFEQVRTNDKWFQRNYKHICGWLTHYQYICLWSSYLISQRKKKKSVKCQNNRLYLRDAEAENVVVKMRRTTPREDDSGEQWMLTLDSQVTPHAVTWRIWASWHPVVSILLYYNCIISQYYNSVGWEKDDSMW